MPASPSRAAPALARRLAAGLRRSPDATALAFFVVLPLLIYLPGAITGAPVIPGDDLTQNEPLRVLAGQLIASGRLPAWDPLIWSGTPLLAGWNAGAMFPGTWLFAFMPAVWSFVLNYAAVPVLAGCGTYLFLRGEAQRPLGAFFGSAIFTYTGFLSGQLVHLGLAQGTALCSFTLLGLQRSIDAPTTRRRLGGIVLGGASLGLVVLAGDPRAISSAIAVLGIYALGKLWRRKGARRPMLADAGAIAVLGAAVGAVQWLPGLAFLHASQRSGAGYVFYASGSLGVPQILRSMLVPFLTGANGNFGMPTYVGDYNLPELTIGVGLVALVAAIAYLPRLWDDLRRWRRSLTPVEGRRPLGTIYLLGLVGVLLTLGSFTPLGHLLVELPLFGGERLQNRNAELCDFALAWLCGYFVDDAAAPLATEARSTRGRALRLASAIPPLGAAALLLGALAAPAGTERLLAYHPVVPSVVDEMLPYVAWALACSAAVLGFVALAPRRGERWRRGALAVLVTADVLTYLLSASYATVPPATLAAHNALSDQVAALTGPDGRFAIYNPAYGQGGPSPYTIPDLGVTDLNILHDVGSVQGYGSIVNGVYQTFTGTHAFESLSTGVLAGESFNTLDLTTLITLPTYLSEPLPAHEGVPLEMPPNSSHPTAWATSGPRIAAPAPFAGGPWPINGVRSAWFVLGAPLELRSVTVDLDRLGRPLPLGLRILAEDGGHVVAAASVPTRGSHVSLSLPTNEPVSAIEVADPHVRPATIGAVIVQALHPAERLLLDGALQTDLVPGHWAYATSIDALPVFRNLRSIGLAWLQPARSKTPNTTLATGRVVVRANSPIAPQVLEVDATHTSELVRAEGYALGWRATVRPLGGGPGRTVSVHRFGLVQAIGIPAGRWLVTFSYAPPTLVAGLGLSALGVLALLVLLALAWRRAPQAGGSGRADD